MTEMNKSVPNPIPFLLDATTQRRLNKAGF